MKIRTLSAASPGTILRAWVWVALALLQPVGGMVRAQNLPSGVELRIIVVDSSAKADRVVQRLRSGEDFAALARELSIDPTASEGGSMGRVDPSSLRAELRESLKGIAPGQISSVVRMPSGYGILKVVPLGDADAQQNTSPARILPSAATGSIRYAPNVGGKGEADLAFRDFPKPEGWSQDLRALCQISQQSLASVIGTVKETLDPANPNGVSHGRPLDVIQMHYALANLCAYQGEMDQAIKEWQAAYQIAASQLAAAMPELEEVLGIAYLHKSEMDNDVYRNPGDRCIFPPRQSVRYLKTGDSEKAIGYFLKYLDQKPDMLDIKWLLNLAYMTLGSYPTGVPQKYLIAPSMFESLEDVGRFVDVAPAAGIKTLSDSGGLIVDDFDNDGLFDVVVSDFDQCAPMHFFHNNGDGTFTDRTAQAGLADQLGGLNMIQVGYN